MGRPSTGDRNQYELEAAGCTVRVSAESTDTLWDDFVERAPGGHFAQTSAWGRARACIGWRSTRVVVSRDRRVLAGAQMAIRPGPMGVTIGFVFKGPLIAQGCSGLLGLVLDELHTLGRACGVQYLLVQPPSGADWMCAELYRRGLRPGPDEITYTATVCVDLEPDLGRIFSRMKRQTRQNIRTAERHGVTVRRGCGDDLAVFNRLGGLHASRLGYSRRSDAYYRELWRAFEPRGHIALFIAEYEGEPVTALLTIPFGSCVRHLERAWSGEHGDVRPNEFIEWETIKWAKSEGYRLVDFAGIRRSLAEALLAGVDIPSHFQYGAQSYKLKFGGQAVLDPVVYCWMYNPVFRLGYRLVPRRLLASNRVARALAGAV